MSEGTQHDLIVGGIPLFIAIGGWLVNWRMNVGRANADRSGVRREFYGLLHRFARHVASMRANGFWDVADAYEVFGLIKERAQDRAVMAALPSDTVARLVPVLIETAVMNIRANQSVGDAWNRRSPSSADSAQLFYLQSSTQLSATLKGTSDALSQLLSAIGATDDVGILDDAETRNAELNKELAAAVDAEHQRGAAVARAALQRDGVAQSSEADSH